jgi:hypothetical protein
MKKKRPNPARPAPPADSRALPPLPVYNMGKLLVDVADWNALEDAMRPDDRSRYRVASTNWFPSGS